MHPRPQATKRARVSFGPDLAVTTATPITKRGSARGHQSGGWGGHWPTRLEMPRLATGKGKEAMEPPTDKGPKTRQVTKADDMTIDTFDRPMPSTPDITMLTTEAPTIRRRGPRTNPKSGHHCQSAINKGARPPSKDQRPSHK